MTAQTLDVVCIGNALVDVLATADDAFLTTHGIHKGSMTLINEARALQLYDAMGPAVEVSGGSAGNTAPGVASLGGRARSEEKQSEIQSLMRNSYALVCLTKKHEAKLKRH